MSRRLARQGRADTRPTTPPPVDVARWKLETKLVGDLLARIERAERARLRRLGLPTDPVALYDILAGHCPHVWPARTRTARAQDQARRAMVALAKLAEVRRYLGPANENARLAAHAALVVGLSVNDAAANAILAERRRVTQAKNAGRRGTQIREHAGIRDAQIRDAAARYRARRPYDRADDTTARLAQHVARTVTFAPASPDAAPVRLKAGTVRKRLNAMKLR